MLSGLHRDFRFVLRLFFRNPGLTAIAIFILALGLGANTAIFSVVHAALLKALPYEDPDRLYVLWEEATHYGFPQNSPAPANFFDWKSRSRSFSGMAALSTGTRKLTGAGEPEQLESAEISANLLDVLGVRPFRGRSLLPGEDRAGSPPVALLSYRLWSRRFGADPAVLGRPVTLNGRSVTVVGVLPPTFHFPSPNIDLWEPFAWSAEESGNREDHYLLVAGRLRPGVTAEAAAKEMTAIAKRLERDHPATNQNLGAIMVPFRDHFAGEVRPTLRALLAAVGFLLLIACANVGNLLLSRAPARRGELAVRIALGASRGHLLRLLLVESLTLALAGAALGWILASWCVGVLHALLPAQLGVPGLVALGVPTLGFTLALATLTGLLCGIVPAWQVSRDCLGALRESGRGIAHPRSRLGSALAVAEIALSLCLLIGAGLVVRSFLRLQEVPLGFRPQEALTLRTVLSEDKYRPMAARTGFYDAVLEKTRALPGVKSAGFASHLPLTFQGDNNTFLPEGEAPPPPGQEHIVSTRVVTPGYFGAMGMSLLEGRDFGLQDRSDGEAVVIVNERIAKRYWPDGAVGRRLHRGVARPPFQWLRIVGVVEDVRQGGIDVDPRPEIYLPQSQFRGFYFVPQDLVIRAAGDPLALAPAVRAIIRSVDPDQPITAIRPLEETVSGALEQRRLQLFLFGGFAAAAWFLACVGLYGVLATGVSQRTHEFGVRMALGARSADLLRGVLRTGIILAASGMAAGWLAALALTRFLSSMLYGVSPTDPLTFAGVSLLMLAMALLASLLPARRATRVDPMVALRRE